MFPHWDYLFLSLSQLSQESLTRIFEGPPGKAEQNLTINAPSKPWASPSSSLLFPPGEEGPPTAPLPVEHLAQEGQVLLFRKLSSNSFLL